MYRAAIFLCACVAVVDVSEVNSRKLIIDNDAGGDDAMAIFLALLYEKHFNGPQVVGLTTANGNTKEDNVFVNNQKILKIANRQDVPIYRGSKSSMVITPLVTDYYGHDGLGDTGDVYTDLVPAQETDAVQALIDLSKRHEGTLTVLTIGSLTNVALAIRLDPGFLDRIAHLYVAAGHIHDESIPEAEFNAHMDVEAYHVVIQNATPDKVSFFPFSQVMSHLNISKEWRLNTLGTIDSDIIKAQNKFEKIAIDKNINWQALDPAAVAVVIKEDLVSEYKYSKSGISLCGGTRGITTNTFVEKSEANARIVYSVREEEYKQFLLDVFSVNQTINHRK